MFNGKRGQTLAIAILSAIVFFIVGMLTINFMMDEITTTRTDLNCASAEDISDGTKLLCLAVDIGVPYWILLIFSVTIGAITARMLL